MIRFVSIILGSLNKSSKTILQREIQLKIKFQNSLQYAKRCIYLNDSILCSSEEQHSWLTSPWCNSPRGHLTQSHTFEEREKCTCSLFVCQKITKEKMEFPGSNTMQLENIRFEMTRYLLSIQPLTPGSCRIISLQSVPQLFYLYATLLLSSEMSEMASEHSPL